MEKKGKNWGWIKIGILFMLAILLKVLSFFPSFIENYYSSDLYFFISSFLRTVTGVIPFSVGDIFYTVFVLWIMVRLYKTSKATLRRSITRESFMISFQRTIAIILWVYILFNFLWGLNYERLGIAYQLQLRPQIYNTNELKALTRELIDKTNRSRKQLSDSSFIYPSSTEIFGDAKRAYLVAEEKYPFLHYSSFSVKSSMYGSFGNYFGFLGYYNPFTGEAQINVTVPSFLIPFTTCHEMAHQLGYGSEDEANFAGYLAAKSSRQNTFQYSGYFELFAYANRELFLRDSTAARENYRLLDTLVKKDIMIYKKFIKEHQNKIEPIISMLYGEYLKANNQP
ncbi:MAG TPA: DUF3810 domain-containing protein, partial [Chitinophagaceae bacterium]|nr:DUF3810 domain-containing protein [Chitinophagaceae bacterium]